MAIKRALSLLSLVGLAIGCGAEPKTPKLERRVETGVDLEAKNLPPNEEIDALLKGVGGVGRAEGTTRLAVPTFKVVGGRAEDAWMGTAVAQIVESRLSHVDGVSVLDRSELTLLIDELKRNDDDTKAAVKHGKLLGAKHVIVGSLMPSGKGKLHAIIKPVSVETGLVLRTVETDLEGDDWMDAVTPAVQTLVEQAQLGAPPTEVVTPMSRESLELAARARDLQYAGRLTEAQPLYEKALAKPSSAWRFEADYVRLMNDLGMFDWTSRRVEAVLGRLPGTPETSCERARLLLEKNRKEPSVAAARTVVRTAATCGDRSVLARALFHYSTTLHDQSIPHAIAAAQRGRALLDNDADLSARCDLDARVYRLQTFTDWKGSREENWSAIAKQCNDAGNHARAAIVLQNAATVAWHPARATELLEQAVTVAQPVGGDTLDGAVRALSDKLRSSGKPSEADAKLLGIVGPRLKAIVSICGGQLPAPENQLDSDFLERAGITKVTRGTCNVEEEKKLLVRIHERALGITLRSWADKTRADSIRQADEYQAIADRLDVPTTKKDPSQSAEKIAEAKLEKAKLPLKSILESKDAPLFTNGANPTNAFDALEAWFWTLKSADPKRAEVVAALAKLAEWTQNPWIQCVAAETEGRQRIDAGDAAGGLVAARAISTYAPGEAYWAYRLIGLEIDVEAKRDPAKARGLRAKRIELARKLMPSDWIWSTEVAAYDDWNARLVPALDVEAVRKVAAELVRQKAWEPAAHALDRVAALGNIARGVDGSNEAVETQRERVRVLSNLGDPLRSLKANADVLSAMSNLLYHSYRGLADGELGKYAPAGTIVEGIAAEARQLTGRGRFRDAARLVSNLHGAAPGMAKLTTEAIGWAKQLEDSAEYHQILGKLYAEQRYQTTDGRERLQHIIASRDAFIAAKLPADALAMQAFAVRYDVGGESAQWAQFDRCVEMANASNLPGDGCVTQWAAKLSDWDGVEIKNIEALKRALAFGLGKLPDWDGRFAPDWRNELRTHLATIAGLAGDRATFDKLHGEVRRYYTEVQKDPYRLATHLSRVANNVGRVDPKLGLSLYQEFDKTPGASDFWRAGEYRRAARMARAIGDKPAEKYFFDTGRRFAAAADPSSLPWYDLDLAYEAHKKKAWAAMDKSFGAAAKEARNAGARMWSFQIDLWHAMATATQPNLAAARAAVAPQVEAAKLGAQGEQLEAPCYHARVLEAASGLEMAAGACAEGTKLRDLASKLRTRCTRDVALPSAGMSKWIDGPEMATWRASNACSKPFSDAASLMH